MKKISKKLVVLCIAAAAALGTAAPVSAGWEQLETGDWQYTQEDAALTGWNQIDGSWYYFDKDGVMQTGWQAVSGSWYYFQDSGEMATGWLQEDGNWYYLESWGGMAVGWQMVSGSWYYFQDGGKMAAGWLQDNGNWYYLESWGGMAVGWRTVDGTEYYFAADGTLQDDPAEIYPAEALEMLEAVNRYREAAGVPALELSGSLSAAASVRAGEIAAEFSHTRPDGSGWETEREETGAEYRSAGENIAYGYSTAEEAVREWMRSPSHKANILNPSYDRLGAACYRDGKTTYWVQIFAEN